MRCLYLVILIYVCSCLVGCYQARDWNSMGHYTGSGMNLWLKSDSTVCLTILYSPNGFGNNGKWIDDGKYIVISFPQDTIYYDPADITQYLMHIYERETIVLEKKRKNHLFWRNRGVLIKDKVNLNQPDNEI